MQEESVKIIIIKKSRKKSKESNATKSLREKSFKNEKGVFYGAPFGK